MDSSANKTNFAVQKRSLTYTLAVTGVMSALVVLLAVTPLGYIKLSPAVNFTILQVPVILAAIFGGPLAGIFSGMVFGITSLVNAATSGTLLAPFTMNPLVSVLPRMFIGLAAWLVFWGLSKLRFLPKAVCGAAAGFLGAWTNAFGYFGMMYLVYTAEVAEKLSAVGKGGSLLVTLAAFGPATLTEALGATVICFLVVGALDIGSAARGSKLSRSVQRQESE